MKTIKLLNNLPVVLYDSIKDLPVLRYNLFNQYAAQDLGMGSDMISVDKHFAKLDQFLAAGDLPAATTERANLQYNLYFAINQINIKSRVFLCMVKSVNGQEVVNLGDDDVVETLQKQLSDAGLTAGDVEDTIDEIKKKLIMN